MKRQRNGNVRPCQDAHQERNRCLSTLRAKISAPLFESVQHLSTSNLLALIRDLPQPPPEDQEDTL